MEVERTPLTFDEVHNWDDDTRWELLDGRTYAMSSPSVLHQDVVLALALRLSPQFQGGPCRLYTAPLDVKLSENDLVQPDLFVVCQPRQNKGGYIDGAPRLIVEVLSPSTQRHDRIRKLDLYGKSAVAECWLVTPHPFMVEVYTNLGGLFARVCAASEKDGFRSQAFPELKLDLAELFASLPPAGALDEVREATPGYLTYQ